MTSQAYIGSVNIDRCNKLLCFSTYTSIFEIRANIDILCIVAYQRSATDRDCTRNCICILDRVMRYSSNTVTGGNNRNRHHRNNHPFSTYKSAFMQPDVSWLWNFPSNFPTSCGKLLWGKWLVHAVRHCLSVLLKESYKGGRIRVGENLAINCLTVPPHRGFFCPSLCLSDLWQWIGSHT